MIKNDKELNIFNFMGNLLNASDLTLSLLCDIALLLYLNYIVKK
jgi:hypothetical protein